MLHIYRYNYIYISIHMCDSIWMCVCVWLREALEDDAFYYAPWQRVGARPQQGPNKALLMRVAPASTPIRGLLNETCFIVEDIFMNRFTCSICKCIDVYVYNMYVWDLLGYLISGLSKSGGASGWGGHPPSHVQFFSWPPRGIPRRRCTWMCAQDRLFSPQKRC